MKSPRVNGLACDPKWLFLLHVFSPGFFNSGAGIFNKLHHHFVLKQKHRQRRVDFSICKIELSLPAKAIEYWGIKISESKTVQFSEITKWNCH